jgi:hypothetical protein
MKLSALIEKAKTGWEIYKQVDNTYDYHFPMDKELRQKIPDDKWVSVDDLKPKLEELVQKVDWLILGRPAVFRTETEFEKGYSKGYYDAKERVKEILKDVLGLSEEKESS